MADLRDARFALRSLLGSKGSTLVAVTTLALAIGATTAVWSVVRAVLLQPLPYRDPDRLMLVSAEHPSNGYRHVPLSGPEIAELRKRSRTVEAVAGLWPTSAALVEDGQPRPISLGLATANLFAVLGVEPAAGRLFVVDDEGAGAPPRVVLGNALWHERFAGDPGVIGRTLRIDGGWGFDGGSFTVVGVAPSSLLLSLPADAGVPPRLDAWIPCRSATADAPRAQFFLRTIARLRRVSIPSRPIRRSARSARQIECEHSGLATTDAGSSRRSFTRRPSAAVRRTTLVLLGAVAFVVLSPAPTSADCCSRDSSHRRRELAMRAAIGATRGQLAHAASLRMPAGGRSRPVCSASCSRASLCARSTRSPALQRRDSRSRS